MNESYVALQSKLSTYIHLHTKHTRFQKYWMLFIKRLAIKIQQTIRHYVPVHVHFVRLFPSCACVQYVAEEYISGV